MLKFETTANIGDVIKAFDFQPMEGRDDSYLTGQVIAKGPVFADNGTYMCDGYTVNVLFSNSGSEKFDAQRKGIEMVVPFEMDMLEYDERVSLVTTKDEFELICSEVPEAA